MKSQLLEKINANTQQTAVDEINRLHNLILETDRTSLEHAIEAGTLLIALKRMVGKHGKWLPYLAQHFPTISERTAQDYMWAARNSEEIEDAKARAEGDEANPQRASDLTSIRGAKSALKKPLTPEQKAEREARRQANKPTKPISPATHGPVSAPIDEQLEDLDVDEVVPAIKDKWDGDQRRQLIVSFLEELPLKDVADVLSEAFPDQIEDLIRALNGEAEEVDPVVAAQATAQPRSIRDRV